VRTFPVKKLIADQIDLGGELLINENGNLLFGNKIVAYYEDLIGINMVSNELEMNLLRPKIGDVAKNTTTSELYIWNGYWVPMFRETVKVHVVTNLSELYLLKGVVGDIATVTSENKSMLYLGNNEWHSLLTGLTGTIDDNSITTFTTWSSSKIDNQIKNHNHDGGNY